MRPSELKALILARVKAGIKRPLFIVGSPGLGKTQIVQQVAKELDIGFKAIHAPLMQPEDYGFPVINAEKTGVRFIVSPDKFPVVGSDCPEQGLGLVDELPQSDEATQKIIANLFQEREIHAQYLKEGWTLIATGNRAGDKSGAKKLLKHLEDRVTEVELEASLDDWVQWALANGVKPEVIAFLRWRPDLLSAFDPQAIGKTPTPRSWVEGVSADLGVVDQAQEFAVFKGSVGEGAAAEFIGFLKTYRELPSPDAVIMNPTKIAVPTKPDVCYALVGALAHRVTENNFNRVITYIMRMKQEYAVLFIKDALKKNNNLANCQDFIAWATSDGAKILT